MTMPMTAARNLKPRSPGSAYSLNSAMLKRPGPGSKHGDEKNPRPRNPRPGKKFFKEMIRYLRLDRER